MPVLDVASASPRSHAGPPGGRPRPPVPFRAHRFRVWVPPGWRDGSTYLLSGPTVDGFSHRISVAVDPQPACPSLAPYADAQVDGALEVLDRGRLLLRDRVALSADASGTRGRPLEGSRDAVRTVIRWQGAERMLFLEQLVVHAGHTAFVLAAPFTRRSRRILGPEVEDALRTLQPMPPPSATG